MNWLIGQLFGSQAVSHLGDKIKALIAQYMFVNPSFTQISVEAWVQTEADHLIAQVLVFFPGWASAILTQLLNTEVNKLATSAFQALSASASQSSSA
jgi:hypothetical protein